MLPRTYAASVDDFGSSNPDHRLGLAGRIEPWVAPSVAALLVGLLAIDQGGYFPTACDWGALGALWVVGLWLVLRAPTESQLLDAVSIGAFAVFAVWTALSITWSDSSSASILETNRAILYGAAIAAVLLMAQPRRIHRLVAALCAVIVLVSLYSLCTRLFPDRLGSYDVLSGYRLSDPIGYWNGLGIFAVVGILISFGLAARGRSPLVRIAGAVALVVLAPALYFTYSRASWIALAFGLACALAYDRRRLQLVSTGVLVLPGPAIATFAAARLHGLTHAQVPLREAVHDGHRLVVVLALLAPVAAGLVLLQILLERRLTLSLTARRAAGAALLAIPIVALGLAFAHYGGPAKLASDAYRSFKASPMHHTNLNKRLFSLTNNGRIALWRVAWKEYKQHNILGSGAGTYSRYWARYRGATFDAQDAHNLYIETLAELGPVGLAALVAALLVPLVAAVRARSDPLAAALLGAYLAFLLHAAADWDFELPGVTLAALFCGSALVVAARRQPLRRVPQRSAWLGGLVTALFLIAFTLFMLIGNSALASSNSARERGDLARAASQARKARKLMPWSPQPWDALGRAQYAAGNTRDARTSFGRAVQKDPGDWTLWFDLAVASKGAARQRAIAHALALNPRSSQLATLRRR